MASESTAANGGEKKKKKKKFGRIRGLLTGESRRERKAKKAAARAAAQQRGQAPPLNVDDDAETVYGVNVETGRTAMQQDTNGAPAGEIVAPKPGGHSLQVILLLLDPHTRRFELLQLEFDSVKAVVRDVLAQVPHSVTEEALCKQKYVGVCDTKGVELINATRLADFCHGSEILLAIPEGLPAKECSRLAKPILTDENVMQMLQQSGIDTSVLNAINDESESKTKETPQKGQKKKSSALVTMVLLALVAVGVQFGHTFVTTPLAPGNTLFPGLGKSKCGYKFMLPSCENSNLFMGFDGVLSLYGPDNKLHWQIIGGTCENAEDCTKGLVVQEDGSLVIGGKNIDTVTAFDYSSTVSPWPFEQNPSLRVVRGMN